MNRIILAGLLLFAILSWSQAQENSEKIELVKSGKLAEARADWWGFNETDSTKALQAAIDSGVKKLIVPNMGKPWIVNPISLASDQEIMIEPGTVIEAIKGGFKGKKDSLFSAKSKKNITISGKDAILRMNKKDYQDKTQYEPAEWRMGIALFSCENVKITGLTIMSSGGDGIYISTCREPINYCKDIVIKDCVIDDNHRQGISVISVVNLLIENCVMKNTKGASPEGGIDFEPNVKQERLFGITVKNCVFENNKGAGVIICSHPGADTEPISINFENCKAIGTGFTGGFGPFPPLSKIDAKMSNCTETVNGKIKVYNDFWKDFQNMQTLDKQKQEIADRVKRIDVRGMQLKPLDVAAYGQTGKLPMPILRNKSSFIVCANEGEKFSFKTNFMRDYGKGMSVQLLSPSGKTD
ncbi:MAG: right-handed parallel beta-helix repeat-containing protein, partial [Lentisphaerota bacterium]